MSLERLNPGSIVELNDPVLGGRKLGLVDDTGVGYFDLHGDGELPKPIHSELNPVGLGSLLSWAAEMSDADNQRYVDAWDQLTSRNLDVLTIARAMYWAVRNSSFEDIDLLERMGRAETDKVLSGRKHIESTMPGN